MSQLEFEPFADTTVPQGATIREQYEAFHAANPWVFTALERLVQDWLAAGRTRVGIGTLWEKLRWEHGVQTRGDVFKLNNNFRSLYARALIEKHPEWSEVFETRRLRAAS